MTVMEPAARPGYSGHKADHLARLARIEGQVRGVAAWSKRTGIAPTC
jgi:hypothetical protein